MVETWRPERRRTPRHPVSFPLHARVGDGVGDVLPVRGLSITGLVVESPEALPAGRLLSFTLEPDDRLEAIGPVDGRVVHSRLVLPVRAGGVSTYVAGIAFDPLPAVVSSRIEELLASVEDPAAGHHS
ncbi:MAG TPA: PilZ domain-containing protein [Luteitalea sp.]|nr:PilZ domain-containing protein [Luteitalea sp.]